MRFGSLRALLLALAGLATFAACGGDDGSSAPEATSVGAAAPSFLAGHSSRQAALPAAGTVQAWLEGDALVSALANQAPRGAIVTALAEAASFELVVGEEAAFEQLL